MFSYWIRSLGNKANLGRKIYPYLFRHSRISELKSKGVDEDDRKIFAGHSANSKMQSVYTHIDNEDMINSVISKVYHVKDLPPEKKHELELEIEQLKNKVSEINIFLEEFKKQTKPFIVKDLKIIPIEIKPPHKITKQEQGIYNSRR